MRTSFNLISSVMVQTANTIRGLFFVLIAVFFGVYPVVLTVLERFRITSELRFRQTTNANLYHVTKFPLLYLSFTVHYFYTLISSFTQFLSIKIVLSCFYLLSFYFEKFST